MSGYFCGGVNPENNFAEPCGAGNKPYFRPDNRATREAVAKIVSNTAGYTESPGAQIYQDVPAGHDFYDWVNRLTRRGIMGGYSCGAPDEPCVGLDPQMNCSPPAVCDPASLKVTSNHGRPYFRPYRDITRGQTAKIVAITFFPSCGLPSRPGTRPSDPKLPLAPEPMPTAPMTAPEVPEPIKTASGVAPPPDAREVVCNVPVCPTPPPSP